MTGESSKGVRKRGFLLYYIEGSFDTGGVHANIVFGIERTSPHKNYGPKNRFI